MKGLTASSNDILWIMIIGSISLGGAAAATSTAGTVWTQIPFQAFPNMVDVALLCDEVFGVSDATVRKKEGGG